MTTPAHTIPTRPSVFEKTFSPESARTLIFWRLPLPIASRERPTAPLPTGPLRMRPALQSRKPRRHTPNAVC